MAGICTSGATTGLFCLSLRCHWKEQRVSKDADVGEDCLAQKVLF